MAQSPIDSHRVELEQEYSTWAKLCEDKHGLPWPIPQDLLGDATDQAILVEIKKLKVLGRTPHE